MTSYETRFSGIGRLFGGPGQARLRRAHVCVVGIGGVGSWAVEALARTGLGALTLVDLDDVCISNVNRQLHALDGEFGKPKVEVMERRVRAINPDCAVRVLRAFFTAATAAEIFAPRFDFVLDAIDSPSKKCVLIAHCRERGIPVLTVGGAGGRQTPAGIQITDLAVSSHDRLLHEVRSKLRARYGFPRRQQPFGVDCVFSTEPPVFPHRNGSVCQRREAGSDLRLDCDSGYGTASFVTGAFAFAAVAHIVGRLAGREANVISTAASSTAGG